MFSDPAPRPHRWATLVLLTLSVPACASLDPRDDLETAQRLVHERTGVPFAMDREGAAHWPPPEPLTADDAARLALQRHPDLRRAIEGVVQARADFVQAHLLPNPLLNVQLGFTLDGISDTIMAMLMQPLAALWERPARTDGAEARLRAQVLSLSHGAVDLVAAARTAQARAVFARRGLALAARDHELATAALDLGEQRLGQGESTGLERNLLALEQLAAAQRRTDAQARNDRAARALLEVCAAADTTDPVAVADEPATMPAALLQFTEVELMATASAQRLDLAAAHKLAEGAIDAVRLAELRRLRSIAVGPAYFRNQAARDAVGLALALELPVLDDGRAEVARSESLARQAEAELSGLHQTVLTELRQAHVDLRAALENRDRLRDTVLELARQNRALADQALEVGALDRLEALRIARQEVQVQLDLNAAERTAVEAFVELERALGGRLPIATGSQGASPAVAEARR